VGILKFVFMVIASIRSTARTRHRVLLLACSVLVVLLVCPAVLAQPYGLSQRPAVGPFLNGILPPAAASASGWEAAVAFPNLTFDDALVLLPEPGTNRLFVCERQGKIFHFPNISTTTNKVLFLDLTAKTQGYNDCGVLGFAFHPQYRVPGSTNRGYVYVYYTYSPSPVGIPPGGYVAPDDTDSYNRLSRFTVPDGSSVADPNSELILINQFDRQLWHNGGGMFFGPDGFLYLTIGDEGGVNDPYNNAQKLNGCLFAGVMRIDVDKDPTKSHPIQRQPVLASPAPGGWPATFTTNYYIPNDNPWVTNNGSRLEEFWAHGFRSPHRMTYDPVENRIWLGDVGQDAREEVNVVVKGGNYQWAYREGNIAGTKATPSPIIGVEKPPVYDYPHADNNNCVIGGYVYRGSAFPSLYGKYIFGDNGSGRIWSMDFDGTNASNVTLLTTVPDGVYSLTTFGQDQQNNLYMCVVGNGKPIYKLAATGNQAPPPPALLSQTGAFTNLATLSPSSVLIPFDVNAPLWSDHAGKQRWMVVPTNGKITFSTNGNWLFPTGTVMVKHFDLPLNDTNPAVTKRLETRFTTLGTNGQWFGYTYKWRADNSDADLLPGSLNETNLVTTATGVRTQVWSYPSRSDCLTCHNPNAGGVLGPRTSQLNKPMLYPATGFTDNQLRTLNFIGMFHTNLVEASITNFPKTAPLTDTNATLELRVRSYLESNCSHCHQPNGARGSFDARFSTPLTNQNIINGPVEATLGIVGARVVRPQATNQSILFIRDSLVGTNQMPPIAKNVVDTNYIRILAQWINSLPITPDLPPGYGGILGNTNTGASSDNIYDVTPYINAAGFVAPSNMTVAFMRAQVQGVTGRYKTALYADNVGEPGALIATSTTVTNPATGWQSFGFDQPVTLTSGETYWCAIWSDSSAARVYYTSTTTGVLRWGQYSFTTAWPDPLVTTAGGTLDYSIYAYSGVKPVFQATPANRTVASSSTITVTNRATDADLPAQALTYYLLNPPAGATISSNGVITWTPSPAQAPSTNQLVTAATDGVFSITNSFQVIVTNANVNVAPVANGQSVTNAEDTQLALVLTGSDPDGPVMNFVVVTNPAFGTLTGTAPNLMYLPNTNYFGADTLAFRVNDGSLTSAVAVVSLTITNVNDAPSATAQSQGVTEDIAKALVLVGSDVDGPVTNFVVVTNPAFGTLSGTPPNLSYLPALNYFGPDSFAFRVNDGSLTSAVAVVTLTVTNVNDAPSANAQSQTLAEDELRALVLTGADVDGPVTNFVVVTNPAFGTLTGTAPNLTYLPNTNYFGTDTLAFRVNDGSLTSAVAVVSLTITNVNDAPAATPQSQTLAEDESQALVLAALDVDGPVTNFVVVTNPAFGTLTGSAPNLTYMPNTNYFGTDTLAFRVNDGSLTSAVAVVSLTITNVNDAPAATPQSQTLAEDESQALVLAGSDVDGPVMNFLVLTNPAHGTLSGTPPNVNYTPVSNYFGADEFAFTVNDGSLTSAVAAVTLNITNVNDAPLALSDALVRWITQGAATTPSLLLTNDTDADNDALSLLSVTNATPAGATVVSSNNLVTYWPAYGDTNAGTFQYLISDNHGGTATGVVSVAVQPDPVGDDVLGITAEAGSGVTVSLSGLPGFTYTVQASDVLAPPVWQNLSVVTADGLGQITVNDTMPESATNRFYRAVRGVVPNP
jgi:uncharacterized repeat protein (TIGR03806 family)